MKFKDLFDAVSLLTPFDVLDSKKVRVGSANDGGYVMLDRFRPAQRVFSYGLSWNIAYELDLASRGHTIFMFDHTIECLTVQHPNFQWFKEGLAAETKAEESLFSLADHVSRLAPTETDMILKLDVEGAEWDALAGLPIDLLLRFEQIVIEMHDLRRFGDAEWSGRATPGLRKLAQHFTLHHVHANNHAPLVLVDGLTVADVIEVSYIRSDAVKRRALSTFFPTHLDAPNDALRGEHPLWFFPYIPVTQGVEHRPGGGSLSDFAVRIDETLSQARAEREPIMESKQLAAASLPLPMTPVAAVIQPGQSLKILCISVHPVLEYDEIQLFESMGHHVFSLGFYTNRANTHNIRPPMIETDWHRQCVEALGSMGCKRVAGPESYTVTNDFCALFDVVLVHHNGDFIAANWDVLRHFRVVWRTIGQGLHWSEDKLREYRKLGIKIVRWSPEEEYITGYIGADAVIRASKNPDDWGGWHGETTRIITFANDFRSRGEGMSFEFHQRCVAGFPFDLYGLGNDNIPEWRGVAHAKGQLDLLREHRLAFVTGTRPAPYTLGFIEAWMIGTPVVHVGRQQFSGGEAGVYEIDRLITNGENGFLVENVDEARQLFKMLLTDRALCEQISKKGRKSAIQFFGRERAVADWSSFFATL